MKYLKHEHKIGQTHSPWQISKPENPHDLRKKPKTYGLKLTRPATRETLRPPSLGAFKIGLELIELHDEQTKNYQNACSVPKSPPQPKTWLRRGKMTRQ